MACIRSTRNLWMIGICVCALVGQVAFSNSIKHIRPELGYVPKPVSAAFLKGSAMGDEQLVFRIMGLMLQNSGDTFGRFSPLKLYNYADLRQWMALEDTLDPQSDYMPSMAAYYFSQTQNGGDVHYLVDYLYEHSKNNVQKKWWWLMQAIYLANHKMEDPDLALKVALPLRNKDLPVMAQQLLAIIYEKRGEFDQAFDIITEIQRNVDDIPERELRYMEYFAEERLKRLDDYEAEVKKHNKRLNTPPPLAPTHQ